ncbi:MAG: hypothetical protein LC116_03645 [Bacteroidetes bacterium]|nr:hypothetical protein [Bacteroidota bacterium]
MFNQLDCVIMTIRIFSACVAFTLVMSGCGGCDKINEIQQVAENVQELSKAAENSQEAVNAAEQRRDERRKRGDTLAMPYQELQKYLPSSVDGYTAEDPSGSTMNITGMSYSTAKRDFVRSSEASGETSRISVELFDYNSAFDIYSGLTILWGANFSMEDDEKYTKTFDSGIKDVTGFEEYYKKDKNANVTYAIGGRFILTIKADGEQSGTDFAKGIVKSMNLSELASK